MLIHPTSYLAITLIVVFNLNWVNCVTISSPIDELSTNADFDVLIFTQRWPITACVQWMNEGTHNVCILPSQKDIWTIHGIWPTKTGSMGPQFCNGSSIFDIDTLKPLLSQLKQFWVNVEKGKSDSSFWGHEWTKHGTCASVLAGLDSENKYFGQGLTWLQQHTMTDLLSKANIEPNNQYSIAELHDGIKSTLNYNPSIHCIREKHTGAVYLSEIRICFNKQLELIDCDGVHFEDASYSSSGIITNCNSHTPINYPSTVPQHLINVANNNDNKTTLWRFPFVNFYKLVQMVKWFTL